MKEGVFLKKILISEIYCYDDYLLKGYFLNWSWTVSVMTNIIIPSYYLSFLKSLDMITSTL